MNTNPTPGTAVPLPSGNGFFEDSYNLVGLILIPTTCIITFLVILANTDYGFLESVLKGIYWGLIGYCVVIIPTCWVFISGNTGIVYQNIFVPEPPIMSDTQATEVIKPVAGQRGLMAGPRFRIPIIERPIGDPIKMVVEKNLLITVEAIDKNRQRYTIKASVPLSPVPGIWLPNYLRISAQAAEEHLTGIFQPWIEQEFITLDGEEVIKNIEDFRAKFEGLLGGSSTLSKDEKFAARFTSRPRIDSVTKAQVAQEADEALANAEKAVIIAGRFAEAGMDKKLALNRALVMIGQGEGIEVDDINLSITGLEGLEHLDVSGLAELLRNKRGRGKGGSGKKQN